MRLALVPLPEHAVSLTAAHGAGLPLVVDSPHSGRDYPADFRHVVSRASLRGLEDGFVDRLLGDAPRHGATLICARFPRAYIDVNRAEDDLDPELLDGPWPGRLRPTQKSDLGVGLVFRRNLAGDDIHAGRLSVEQVLHRVHHYYRPYHRCLREALDRLHARHGRVWHLNMHSMPAQSAVTSSGRPDFCLGDRHGRSCAPELTRLVADTLAALGYMVSINEPYAGVELVRRYSAPATGRHSLQIEINRGLYLDERRHCPHGGLQRTREALDHLFGVLAAELGREQAAAE